MSPKPRKLEFRDNSSFPLFFFTSSKSSEIRIQSIHIELWLYKNCMEVNKFVFEKRQRLRSVWLWSKPVSKLPRKSLIFKLKSLWKKFKCLNTGKNLNIYFLCVMSNKRRKEYLTIKNHKTFYKLNVFLLVLCFRNINKISNIILINLWVEVLHILMVKLLFSNNWVNWMKNKAFERC